MENNTNKISIALTSGRKKFLLIAGAALLVAVMLLGGFIGANLSFLANKQEISSNYITGKLENMGELTTQKLTYSGIYTIKEGTIPLITEKGFTMSYNAEVKAGIDFEQVEIDIKKNTVSITLPHAKVLSLDILEDSIKFISEKKAIFNWTEKTDITKAIANAEQTDLNSDFSSLCEVAENYAETLIHKIFDGSCGGRDVEVSFK